jgi:hypothetical protein
MGPEALSGLADEPAAVQFVLDSHHLARLDRLVAHARRQARRRGHEFTGVVIEVVPARPGGGGVADLAPRGLG